jgi:hypothetical protein
MKRKPRRDDRCTKLSFNDEKSARKMAKRQTEVHGVYNRAYECKCGKWHLTTEKLRDWRNK